MQGWSNLGFNRDEETLWASRAVAGYFTLLDPRRGKCPPGLRQGGHFQTKGGILFFQVSHVFAYTY